MIRLNDLVELLPPYHTIDWLQNTTTSDCYSSLHDQILDLSVFQNSLLVS